MLGGGPRARRTPRAALARLMCPNPLRPPAARRWLLCLASALLALAAAPVDTLLASEAPGWEDWGRRAVYQVLTDRFAQPSSGRQAMHDCTAPYNFYCGGGWRGIQERIGYIQASGGNGFPAPLHGGGSPLRPPGGCKGSGCCRRGRPCACAMSWNAGPEPERHLDLARQRQLVRRVSWGGGRGQNHQAAGGSFCAVLAWGTAQLCSHTYPTCCTPDCTQIPWLLVIFESPGTLGGWLDGGRMAGRQRR